MAVGCNPQLASDLSLFSETFDHTVNGADAAGRLHGITQGARSAAEYTLEFRTLAADSGWDNNALRSAYKRGLSEEIKDLLVRDQLVSFQDLITLAIRMDERLREQRLERAQRPGSSARTFGVRPAGPDVIAQAPTSVPPLTQPHILPARPSGEDEPMQLGRAWAGPLPGSPRTADA